MEISREVHDVIGQSLTALKFDLFWVKENTPSLKDQHNEKFVEMDGIINKTIEFAQKISTKLRPELLYDLGIEHALAKLLEEFENRTAIKANLVIEDVKTDFNHTYGINLFRIVQESLTNIARHSNATSLEVKIKRQDDNVLFIISDNGVGIKEEQISAPKSLGLLGIKERVYSINSEISIQGIPNLGTKIKILIPQNNIYSNDILTVA